MAQIDLVERPMRRTANVAGRYVAEADTDVDQFLQRAAALGPSAAITPFQTANWLGAWLALVGPSAAVEPLLITVRDTFRGEIAMLLPLVVRRVCGVTLVEFADLSVSDYNVPLLGPAAPSTPEAAAAAFEAALEAMPEVDVIRLCNLPLTAGGRINPLGLLASAPSSTVRNVTALPQSWDDYLASRPRKFRKALRQHHRALDALGGVRVRMITSPDDRTALLFGKLDQFQRARIAGLGMRYVLDRPAYAKFYREVFSRGQAMLSVMESGDSVVAVAYSLLHRQSCTTVRLAHAGAEWSRGSPGIVLASEIIRWLIDNRVEQFDLGAGGYDYKRQLGCEPQPLLVLEKALTLKGRMALSAWSTYSGGRSLVRSLAAKAS
ncbi:GNAT family N-acetyltransferase [Rhodopseudomonas sp. WA056]|uniref:GNAT family N-acetyltransferase n=1 Tax=Rhodopseudomonas sp. WA056 TaxID=2269367 RepID=UPI0013DFBD26|nr:GNAT family N-acetyltransferase [Rhodopseudomonas sp. WA056]NEW87698.1 GNAT family N-acetyltransferase [Rhodopseudomonas sp. WA056]